MAYLISNISNQYIFESDVNNINLASDLSKGFSNYPNFDSSWFQTSSTTATISLQNNSGDTAVLTGTFSTYPLRVSSLAANLSDGSHIYATGSLSVSQYGSMSGYINHIEASSMGYAVEATGSIWPYNSYANSTVNHLKIDTPNYQVELGGSFNMGLNSGYVNLFKLKFGDQSLSISGTRFDINKYTNDDFNIESLYSLALTGNDSILGSASSDYLNGYSGSDIIEAGYGFDTVYGGLGNDYIQGGFNGDQIFGEDGNDDLRGGNGLDLLVGGAGNDTIRGAKGTDTLTGGEGSDLFVFATDLDANINIDTLTDFVSGVDRIELSASIFTAFGNQIGSTVGIGQNLSYNQSTGVLSYDADGAGFFAPVAFAIIGTASHPLIGNDFVITA